MEFSRVYLQRRTQRPMPKEIDRVAQLDCSTREESLNRGNEVKTKKEKKRESAQPSRLVFSQVTRLRFFS
jgi:hypothetical protein